jgi:SAM-dependent methyltransferase
MSTHSQTSLTVEDIFWIVLGRAPTAVELRDEQRAADPSALRMRLLSSAEFHTLRSAWQDGIDPQGGAAGRERGLQDLGPDDRFVRCAYLSLFGRPPDDGGFHHYTAALASKDTRSNLVRALMLSAEFDEKLRNLAPQRAVVPRDTQLCELANPAKWDNPEWLDILRSLGLSDDKLSMHRKPYEFTQLIFGCRRLGVLDDDARILSVGAGHETVLYWLANHAGHVIGTDLYEGVWQDRQGREGDPGVIGRPEDFAPFPYRRNRLVFMKMDGRALSFRDGSFDVVYSLSSIEHFGGFDGAAATMREMARVLKPGGILALATEYVLQGPPHEETFQPAEFTRLIDQPGLTLVQPIDDSVYRRYEHAAIDLHRNPYQSPHMVVRLGETIFTTVMVFLRKT